MPKKDWVKSFKNFQIFVPASISNLGCGFDSLGLAVSLYFKTSVFSAPQFHLKICQNGKSLELPTDENLFLKAFSNCYPVSPDEWRFQISIETEIPLKRGLGSSACAVLSAILLAEKLLNLKHDASKILQSALQWESHPDNLCASLLGGFTVAMQDQHGAIYRRKPAFPRSLKILLLIPELEISTSRARALLPDAYSRESVISNIQRLAYFMACLQDGNYEGLRESVQDRIHQPYRATLMPFAHDLLNMQNFPDESAIVLSGSGPTFAVFYRIQEAKIRSVIQQIMSIHKTPYELRNVIVDNEGARIEALED